jgi:hypothetical protein
MSSFLFLGGPSMTPRKEDGHSLCIGGGEYPGFASTPPQAARSGRRNPDGLRSTPRRLGHRDVEVFPEAAERHRLIGYPLTFWLRVHRPYVSIVHDGFYLPEPLGPQLSALYSSYVDWWVGEARAKRQPYPRHGLGWATPMRDYVAVTVLAEHAAWWIGLYRTLASYAYDVWAEERRALQWARDVGVLMREGGDSP